MVKWYPYDTHNQSSCYPSLSCLDDYIKGPHWHDAKSINSIVLAFAKLLLGARSTAVYHLGGLPNSHPPPISGASTNLTGGMIRSLEGAADPTGLRGHFLLGEFELEDGRTAIMVHNQDPARTQWATVTFAPELNLPKNASGVLEVDPVHATLAPLMDDSPLHPGLQIGLKPGMARFLVTAPGRTAAKTDDDTKAASWQQDPFAARGNLSFFPHFSWRRIDARTSSIPVLS